MHRIRASRDLQPDDASKRKRDHFNAKMNYKINWCLRIMHLECCYVYLLCCCVFFLCSFFHCGAHKFEHTHMCVLLVCLPVFFIPSLDSFFIIENYLKFMQQQMNIVGMIINALVSYLSMSCFHLLVFFIIASSQFSSFVFFLVFPFVLVYKIYIRMHWMRIKKSTAQHLKRIVAYFNIINMHIY